MPVVAWRAVRLRVWLFSCLVATGCVPDERPRGSGPKPDTSGTPARTPEMLHVVGNAAPHLATQVAPGPKIEAPFVDTFDRAELGADWNQTGSGWVMKDGRLCVSDAKNHPAWLRRRLPTNARIEFEATSASPDGDLKAEAWGDGQSAATGTSYTDATSYIVIFGGWKNTFHVLARLDEHAKDRTAIHVEPGETDPRAQPVLPDRAYRFKIERSDGKTVRYFVDDIEILSLKDPNPLLGEGHEHFGFNDWQVPACFDNLTITPLKS
jgi:hypothetical protein